MNTKNWLKFWGEKIFNSEVKIFSVLLFFVLLIAFGVMIPWLGFYWDDWETILVGHQFSIGEYWNYFTGTRPLAAWTYLVFYPLLGASPLAWQILSLLLRGITALAFWWVMYLLWPEKKEKATWVAILFVVYPVFRQQSIAVSYHQHWLAFTLYFLSIVAMLKSITADSRKWLWFTLSILFQIGHISILEYFLGLELLRPVYCCILFTRNEYKTIEKMKQSLIYSFPNLLVFVLFFIWRMWFFVPIDVDTNSPVLLKEMFNQPAETMLQLSGHALQDSAFVIFGSWFDAFSPKIFNAFPGAFLLVQVFLGIMAIAAGYAILSFSNHKEDEENNHWSTTLIGLGIVALFLGGLQIWITDRQAYSEGAILYSDRFLLPAMPGAALLWVGLIDWFGKNVKSKIIIIAFMVSAVSMLHIRVANDFRWSWINQQRVYWQLYWRAPWIEPQINFFSDQLPFAYVLPNFSFQVLYDQPENPDDVMGNFYRTGSGYPYDLRTMKKGALLQSSYRNFEFSSMSTDSLVLYYHPEDDNNCIWILEPDDRDNPMLPDDIVDVLKLSNTNRIHESYMEYSGPDPVIFGQEPQHNWCYYYQKAALAGQFEDWDEILRLAEQASDTGYEPSNSQSNSPYEWIPFIQAYMHDGNMELAADTLISTYRTNTEYQAMLCRIWFDGVHEEQKTTSFIENDEKINEVLECDEVIELNMDD